MQRIDKSGVGDKEVAVKTLSWLFHAQRPLTMNELLEALFVEEDDHELDPESLLDSFEVIECCKSLVTYDKESGLVRFTHYTVQEFIGSHMPEKLSWVDMAMTCLTYLMFDEFDKVCVGSIDLYNRARRYKLSRYVSYFWGCYARESEEDPKVQEAVLAFFVSERKFRSMLQLEAYTNSSYFYHVTEGQSVLHMAAKNGLAIICNQIILDWYFRRFVANRSGQEKSRFVSTPDERGLTALHMAASKGYDRVVKVLLDAGAVPSVVDKKGETPLHLAASHGHHNVVAMLLTVDPEIATVNGQLAFTLAVQGGHEKVVEMLIKANVDPSAGGDESALHLAVRNGHEKIVQMLLNANVSMTKNGGGQTPLFVAALQEQSKILEMLLAANADVAEADNRGETALHPAARCGNQACVKLLLDAKADASKSNDRGETALHLAAEYGHNEIVQLLLGMDVDTEIPTKTGETALYKAGKFGHDKVVESLLNVKADSTQDIELAKCSTLHEATREGHTNVVKLLLRAHANVSAIDDKGETPLHLAAWYGHKEIVELLLAANANVVSRNKDGDTPLHKAMSGRVNVLSPLLRAKPDIGTQNNDGETALHVAAGRQGDFYEMVELMLAADADVNTADNDGDTPLHSATFNGNLEVIKILLKAKADPAIRNKEGETALHLAAKGRKNKEVAQLLVGNSDVLAQDMEGMTALHVAARNGYLEMVKMLSNAKADMIRDNNGDTALHVAAKFSEGKVISFLLDIGWTDISTRNNKGETPLHEAASISADAFRLFLSADSNPLWKDAHGRTAFHLAAQHGVNVVEPLREWFDAKDDDGRTALHYAAREGDLNVVEALLKVTIDIGITDDDDLTALEYAEMAGHKEVVGAILNAMALEETDSEATYPRAKQLKEDHFIKELVRFLNTENPTVLHWAATEGHQNVIKMLLNSDISRIDDEGRTAFDCAMSAGHEDISNMIKEAMARAETDEINYPQTKRCKDCRKRFYNKRGVEVYRERTYMPMKTDKPMKAEDAVLQQMAAALM